MIDLSQVSRAPSVSQGEEGMDTCLSLIIGNFSFRHLYSERQLRQFPTEGFQAEAESEAESEAVPNLKLRHAPHGLAERRIWLRHVPHALRLLPCA